MEYPLSSSLRSRYDYFSSFSSSQPLSNVISYYDNQETSLFGDPVPPAPSTTSGFSDTFSSSILESFSRHIDPKLAISYQKADLWQNTNKNIYKARASTAAPHRSESPSAQSVTLLNPLYKKNPTRASTSLARKRPRVDYSMISTITKDARQPSFTRIDYQTDYDSETHHQPYQHYAASPTDYGSEQNYRSRSIQSAYAGKRRIVESPSVQSLYVRPYSRYSHYSDYCIEEEREDMISPRPAIISNTVPIGDGYRIKDARTHKLSSFSVINEKPARQKSQTPYLVDPINEIYRPRSASLDSTMTRESRLLSPDSVRDFKYGKFPRSQSSILLSKKRAHEATIIRPDKFKQEPNAAIGKSRRMYHGKVPQYWKRAGHDTRIMHNLRESSNGTDIRTRTSISSERRDVTPATNRDSSIASDKTATDKKKSSTSKFLNIPNPTSQQKGLLRQLTKDSNDTHFEPKPLTEASRSKSAFKMPGMTAAQKLAAERARRAKSSSPANAKAAEPQYLEVKKRLTTPFEVVETEVKEPTPEPPPSVKRVSKASNLSPIAGTPSKLSQKTNEEDTLSITERVASAITTKAKQKDNKDSKDNKKDKEKSTKEKIKDATSFRGRLKMAVTSNKNEKDKKSSSREKSLGSAGTKKSAVSRTKSIEKKSAGRDRSAKKSSGKDRDSGKERSTTREKSAIKSSGKDRLKSSNSKEKGSAKSSRGTSGRPTSSKKSAISRDKDVKGKDKKKDSLFKEKGSLIKNLGFLRGGKKKPEKDKSKSASSSSGKDSARTRKSTAVERKNPKLKLQKSISAGTLKSQDSTELKKEIELNKSASFRLNRKDLTSALSNRLRSAVGRPPTADKSGESSNASSRSSSIFSLSRMKGLTHKKVEEVKKSVKKKRLDNEIAEEEARKSGRRLEKIDSKDSVMSQKTIAGDTQSITSKKTNISDSSTSLKRLKVGNVGGITTSAIAANTSNLTGTVTDYFDQKEVDGGKKKLETTSELNEGTSITDNVILEKSKKTLESIQRTVSDAAEEIQKTIEENLTDLQTLENSLKNPSVPPSAKSKVSSRGDDGVKTTTSRIVSQKSFDNESNNNNNNSVSLVDVENNNVIPMASSYEKENDQQMKTGISRLDGKSDKLSMKGDMDKIETVGSTKMTPMAGPSTSKMQMSGRNMVYSITLQSDDDLARVITSTDDLQDAASQPGCLGKICGPCKRKKSNEDNEMQPGGKLGAFKKLNCFKRQKKEGSTATLQSKSSKMEKPGICSKLMCCKRKDKVSEKSDMMENGKKTGIARICPCMGRKNKEDKMKASKAWTNKSISTTSAPKKGCFGRFIDKLMCCRKKPTEEERRASIISKKASIGPTVKTEDSGPKIDMSLVEHASMMRAAVPVLKIPMAWVCLVFNVLVPGLGTIISGCLCLCFGHPRFSASDNWRGRIGTFVINIIVGISQAFTIIFCLVGWGWSIWWGMMMVELAKKHKKLMLDAALAENVEEGTISSNRTGAAPPVLAQNHGGR